MKTSPASRGLRPRNPPRGEPLTSPPLVDLASAPPVPEKIPAGANVHIMLVSCLLTFSFIIICSLSNYYILISSSLIFFSKVCIFPSSCIWTSCSGDVYLKVGTNSGVRTGLGGSNPTPNRKKICVEK